MYINVSFILLFKIIKIFDFSKILVEKFFLLFSHLPHVANHSF